MGFQLEFHVKIHVQIRSLEKFSLCQRNERNEGGFRGTERIVFYADAKAELNRNED